MFFFNTKCQNVCREKGLLAGFESRAGNIYSNTYTNALITHVVEIIKMNLLPDLTNLSWTTHSIEPTGDKMCQTEHIRELDKNV